jgi:type VI protein secretion system component VasK
MSRKKRIDAPADLISVAAHPRARQSIRRTRAGVALAAFGLVLFLSLSSGVPGEEAALRALIAGLIGNLAGYACALAVWRALIMAEIKAAGEKHRERQAALRERAAELIEAERRARAEKAAAT